MRKAFVTKLRQLARHDRDIMLVSGDLGYNFFEEFIDEFPSQFLNVGIMEQSMMGIAAGMAMSGKKVFVYSIANFPTLRCLEQIRNDVCYHHAEVKIITNGGGMCYGTLGVSHHGTEDLSVMRALPNMLVAAPGDPVEADALVDYVYGRPGPAYVRMGRGGEKVIHDSPVVIRDNQPLRVRDGKDVLLLATGEILAEACNAAASLREKGLDAGVYSFPVINPMTPESLAFIPAETRLVVTIEENNLNGGFGGAVAENLIGMKNHPVLLRIGLNNEYPSKVGKQNFLRECYGISAGAIVNKVMAQYRDL